MNAELSKKSRVGSHDFLEGLKEFHTKAVKGNITKNDFSNFSQMISSISTDSNKQFNISLDPNEVDSISNLVHQIGDFLKSKENTEKMSQMIPAAHLKQAVDNLTQYVDEVRKKAKTVTPKDPDSMPKGHK
jgi:hypothetical protein